MCIFYKINFFLIVQTIIPKFTLFYNFIKKTKKNRFIFDLHGLTLDKANSKVKDIILFCVENNYKEILLITGAGGAIGYIIRESGVINDLSLSNVSGLASILSIFFIAALVKTIQGSSTVAIVTTCAITAPLIQSIGMTSELEKVILCYMGYLNFYKYFVNYFFGYQDTVEINQKRYLGHDIF